MDALDIQGVIVDCDLLQNPQLANAAFHFGTREPNKTKHFDVHIALDMMPLWFWLKMSNVLFWSHDLDFVANREAVNRPNSRWSGEYMGLTQCSASGHCCHGPCRFECCQRQDRHFSSQSLAAIRWEVWFLEGRCEDGGPVLSMSLARKVSDVILCGNMATSKKFLEGSTWFVSKVPFAQKAKPAYISAPIKTAVALNNCNLKPSPATDLPPMLKPECSLETWRSQASPAGTCTSMFLGSSRCTTPGRRLWQSFWMTRWRWSALGCGMMPANKMVLCNRLPNLKARWLWSLASSHSTGMAPWTSTPANPRWSCNRTTRAWMKQSCRNLEKEDCESITVSNLRPQIDWEQPGAHMCLNMLARTHRCDLPGEQFWSVEKRYYACHIPRFFGIQRWFYGLDFTHCCNSWATKKSNTSNGNLVMNSII